MTAQEIVAMLDDNSKSIDIDKVKSFIEQQANTEAKIQEQESIIQSRREKLINRIIGRIELNNPANQGVVEGFKTRCKSMTFDELDAELNAQEDQLRAHYQRLTLSADPVFTPKPQALEAFRITR